MNQIITIAELSELIEADSKDHKLKDIAVLFLKASNEWPRRRPLINIADFINTMKAYFGDPLTIAKISRTEFNSFNAGNLEAGSSIVKMIKLSADHYNESNFDKILEMILEYYSSIKPAFRY